MKKIVSILLAVVLMCSNLIFVGTANAHAAETLQDNTVATPIQMKEFVHVNPLYEDVEDAELSEPINAMVTLADPEYTSDINVVAGVIRDAMVNREPNVSVYYKSENALQDGFFDEWLKVVFADLSNPKAGDYLERHYSKMGGETSGYVDGNGVYYYTITLNIEYYTTAEQETKLDTEVEKVLKEIGVSKELSDYDNLKRIYDYLCENVTYDYTNLNNSEYKLKYSAYAALINKTAVCQGYSSLLYYMARKSGLDVRIVRGQATNGLETGAHAWNIAKVDGWYYNLDVTWDAGRKTYDYFLVGSDNFKDHIAEEKLYGGKFLVQHRISETNYDLLKPQAPPEKFNLANAKLMTPDGQDFEIQDFVYDGKEKRQPEFVLCDENGVLVGKENYDIFYKNNINTGTAFLIISGKGDYYTGTLEKAFYINKASIADLTIKLSETRYVWDGSAKSPTVIVKTPKGTTLIEGVDYWVRYDANRKDVGTYWVKVTIDCNYRGATRLYFEIVPQGNWVQDHIGWWYQRADGTYPYGGWEMIDGDWYYFDASGYRVTGWVKDGGVWYYLMEKGTNRPETEDIENPDIGKMLHGVWFGDKDGKKYYLQANGAMTTGWFFYNQDWYYFNASGALQTGWQLIGGTWYYFEEYGEMVTGWQLIGDTWYYFNESGAMVTGWQLINGIWYYLHGSGAMAANQWVGNYYLQSDGSMAVSKRIGVYYVGADGAWIPGA